MSSIEEFNFTAANNLIRYSLDDYFKLVHSKFYKDINIDFILGTVSEVTNVKKERILHGTDRSDERKIATSLFVYFLKKEFNFYSYADIKKILPKDESALSRYNQMIENLPTKPKSEFDKTLAEYVNKIELLLTEKKYK